MNFKLTDTKTNTVAMRIEALTFAGAKRVVTQVGAVGIFDDWVDDGEKSTCRNYLLEANEIKPSQMIKSTDIDEAYDKLHAENKYLKLDVERLNALIKSYERQEKQLLESNRLYIHENASLRIDLRRFQDLKS